MKYCNNCILPNTRPNLTINKNGVCNACESHNTKLHINWSEREKKLQKVIENAKLKSNG